VNVRIHQTRHNYRLTVHIFDRAPGRNVVVSGDPRDNSVFDVNRCGRGEKPLWESFFEPLAGDGCISVGGRRQDDPLATNHQIGNRHSGKLN
jgi:hypothetical protein